jgi:hypothetical protein
VDGRVSLSVCPVRVRACSGSRGETNRVCDCSGIRSFFRDYTGIFRAYPGFIAEFSSLVRARACIRIYSSVHVYAYSGTYRGKRQEKPVLSNLAHRKGAISTPNCGSENDLGAKTYEFQACPQEMYHFDCASRRIAHQAASRKPLRGSIICTAFHRQNCGPLRRQCHASNRLRSTARVYAQACHCHLSDKIGRFKGILGAVLAHKTSNKSYFSLINWRCIGTSVI